jgi:hypothetical protein
MPPLHPGTFVACSGTALALVIFDGVYMNSEDITSINTVGTLPLVRVETV